MSVQAKGVGVVMVSKVNWGDDEASWTPRVLVMSLLFSCQVAPVCDPVNCSPSGFPVHGISQARILESVAISFSRRSSQARDQAFVSLVSCLSAWI